jgi:large subunit ribosomal protein L15e
VVARLNRRSAVVIDMAKSFYTHIRDEWKNLDEGEIEEVQWRRLQDWREQGAVERIERPTRLDRARSLGYKAKQGVVVVRSRIRKGSARKPRPNKGRRSKRLGTTRITRDKSLQRIAEERASEKHPNLEVLNSYWVGADGSHKWFEVILLDPEHPAIQNDDDLGWVADSGSGRAERGKTSAGQRGRGQSERGKGTEKTRPSSQ